MREIYKRSQIAVTVWILGCCKWETRKNFGRSFPFSVYCQEGYVLRVNRNFTCLDESYFFQDIASRIIEFSKAHPSADIIKMGIGDVTLPLSDHVVEAMERAAREMKSTDTFRGYGPHEGYGFLRDAICTYYDNRQIVVETDEIFVSDGAKSDVSGILDLFAPGRVALVPDPVYPVYVDSNIISGNTVICLPGIPENNFVPKPDYGIRADLIYLCSPNNPTGAAYTVGELEIWVDYAERCDAVILYDCAYESFIRSGKPTSIYQIEGAKSCAIEIGTLSKMAGFTGTRCGYTIVPKDLVRDNASLNRLWDRRQATKTNGVSYIIQKGAQAALSQQGLAKARECIDCYMENAKIICDTLQDIDIWHTGGEDAPYVWLKCPGGMSSWAFFDKLLEVVGVAGTPGVGYGGQGEGFFRLSAFSSKENTIEAMRRIKESFRFLGNYTKNGHKLP